LFLGVQANTTIQTFTPKNSVLISHAPQPALLYHRIQAEIQRVPRLLLPAKPGENVKIKDRAKQTRCIKGYG